MTTRFTIPAADLAIDADGSLTAELIEREEFRAASTCPECGTDHSDPMACAPLDCGTCGDPAAVDDFNRLAFERDHRAGMAFS